MEEIRLGGLLLRLKSSKERLVKYVNKEISIIEELEEDILDSDGRSNNNHRKIAENYNYYLFNATVNNL